MSLPSTMKAVKMVSAGKAEVQDAPLPELRDGTVLVKTTYVAINPTDWKHTHYIVTPGATVGCDFAGVVAEVGPNAGHRWKKGDRIAGVVHGANALRPSNAAFAEYVAADAAISFKIPDNVKDEEAAGMGVAIATTNLALYQKLGLPMPGVVPFGLPILIYGGSSGMGSVAIQYAKISGARVITTCSPRNFDFVKSLGADEVFDYNDPDCAKKIREITKDKLHHVVDTIGGEGGSKICTDSISSVGGQLATILVGTEYARKDEVREKKVLAYSAMGEAFQIGDNKVPNVIEDYDLTGVYFRLAEKLLAEGKIKTHPPKVGQGLEGVIEGMEEMRQGKVSANKLTYKIS